MISGVVLKRLTQDHEFKPFDCGNQDLNDFLLKDSKLYLKNLLAVTYIFETEDETIAYFSVSNDKISVTDTPKSVWRRLKRLFSHALHRRDYPAVKLGRFAVALKYQLSSIGTDIMEFIKNMFVTKNRTGCAFITVDALIDAIPFYIKNDFIPLEDDISDTDKTTVQLYFNLNRCLS